MHIGLIGGIGVAATIVYYQRLTAAVDRLGSKLDVTISHGDIQTLIRNNLADDRATQAELFARQIERLKAAGCDCVALTSLGAHFCVEEMNALSSLPVISGVAPLDGHFTAQGIRRVGLLGTRVVMRTRLYGQLQQTSAVALDAEIDLLGQAYQDMAQELLLGPHRVQGGACGLNGLARLGSPGPGCPHRGQQPLHIGILVQQRHMPARVQ